ncbi:hypothetical protein [Endozoicomonas numazuensis]|uniref:MACPF domain-containing protein n=1 Tax=Endozoicomonas numazuensis TaxID=1137799 RepID=A0A081NEL8_9GAMM|nr:hypothetical protein [Endozoicomonas numazuensis]KEQ16891.1 hypothetical protein GZ78_19760 [Endozoicomonas numazuensis]
MRDLTRAVFFVLIFLPSSLIADDSESSQLDLGMGYSSDEGRVLGVSCLKAGTISHIGSDVGTVQFGRQVSSSDVQLNLGVNLDGSASYDIFTGSAKVKYALETEEDKRVETYTFVESVVSGASSMSTTGVAEDALNELGQSAYAKGPEQFRAACGDQFVESANTGGRLLVSFRVKFDSEYQKHNFEEESSAKFTAIGNLMDSLKVAHERTRVHGHVEIMAMQLGGTPQSLAKLFIGKDKDEKYFVTSCQLKDLDKCKELVGQILEYAANDFSTQITEAEANGSNPVQYSYRSYNDVGLKVGPSLVTEDVQNARVELEKRYKETRNVLHRASRTLNAPYEKLLVSTVSAKLREAKDAAEFNMSQLMSLRGGIKTCFIDISSCKEASEVILKSWKKVDPELLSDMSDAWYFHDESGADVYALPIGDDLYVLGFPEETHNSYVYIVEVEKNQDGSLSLNSTSEELSLKGELALGSHSDVYTGPITFLDRTYTVSLRKVENPIYIGGSENSCHRVLVESGSIGCVLHVYTKDNPSICGGNEDESLVIGTSKALSISEGVKLNLGCKLMPGHKELNVLRSGHIHCSGVDKPHPDCDWVK